MRVLDSCAAEIRLRCTPSTSEARMEKPELKEHDGMRCRACGNEERASEGYPCADCGTFICLICTFRGVTRCKACEEKAKAASRA